MSVAQRAGQRFAVQTGFGAPLYLTQSDNWATFGDTMILLFDSFADAAHVAYYPTPGTNGHSAMPIPFPPDELL